MLNRWNFLKTGFYEGIKGACALYDLASTNGTWVNDGQVSGSKLEDGSTIPVGSSGLYFTRLGASMSPGVKGLGKNGVLMVRSGPSAGKSFPVGDQDIVIGREPGPEGAQLDDPKVNLRHALVRPTPGGCLLYDLGSYSGTKLDDVGLEGKQLNHGDVIRLGEAELQFVREESP